MASYPPRTCCFQGVKHEGDATGDFITIDDIEAYKTAPASGPTEKGIILLTDILGHRFKNAQLIADQFAANGYLVLIPDLFYGDPIPIGGSTGMDLQKWLAGEYHEKNIAHTPPVIDPILEKCISEMRTKYNIRKIGAIGYCFGAKYVVRFLNPDQGKVDVGFIAHPSLVEKEELEAIKGPLAIAAAEKDHVFPAEKRHESERVLESLALPYTLTLYGGVGHGFALRGDLSDPKVLFTKENVFVQALQWFYEHLKT
ncbi:Alpha/Beta hydrolase protein [Aspergillus cavernicola]|uniref:Alpha/Beta hydrolase protein n=1 Tax=Aspergillus cavernicola TaxID=176166 RepID=A0ABR4IUK6_9EURO